MTDQPPTWEEDLIMQILEQTSDGQMPHEIGTLLRTVLPAIVRFIREVDDDDVVVQRVRMLPHVCSTLICAACTSVFEDDKVPKIVGILAEDLRGDLDRVIKDIEGQIAARRAASTH